MAPEGKAFARDPLFSSLKVNGQSMKFGQEFPFDGRNVYVQRSKGTILIYNVMPGAYSVELEANIKLEGIADQKWSSGEKKLSFTEQEDSASVVVE